MSPQLFPDREADNATEHVLTIGNFDGVHLGHQLLLGQVVTAARQRGVLAGALTFDPLPLEVLRPEISPPRLTTTQDRISLIRALGVDTVVPIRFTREVAGLAAPEFVEQVVMAFRPVEIIVGDDFAFGHNRSGNPELLRELGESFGYSLRVIERVGDGPQDFSSSRARARLVSGDVREAASILGRPHLMRGTVIVGKKRGRELGFPTANLSIAGKMVIPADGIYAAMTQTTSGGPLISSMVYVGTNPTFEGDARVVEVNLLDFEEDLYGREVSVLFVERVRGDQRFATIEQLIEQMYRDRERTLAIIEQQPSDWPGAMVQTVLGIGKGALTDDK